MPVFESSTVLVLDLSASMEVRDLGASRFSAAKALAGRILERATGRVGLIVYEGSAEIVAPLTEDHAAVDSLVQSLQTGELDEAGSDVSLALEAALDLASKGGNRSTEVVFISDGEHRGRPWDEQLAIARSRGVRVSAILLGTPEGGPIPVGDDKSLLDDNGSVVISRTSSEPLKTIVEDCGGEVWVNPFGEETLEHLQQNVGKFSGGERFESTPVERYQWPLGASLLLFLASAVVNRGAE